MLTHDYMIKNSQVRLLILGGDGMLGHQLWKHFSKRSERFDARVTLRRDFRSYEDYRIYQPELSYSCVDVRNFNSVLEVFSHFQPNVVINTIGIIKQRPTAKDKILNIEINALLPHKLALLCQSSQSRLIHISTDCVFSGAKGNYTEQDIPDPIDLYGHTKLLGELNQPQMLTLRTSIIGRELDRKTSLVEWFLNSQSPVKGFINAIYNGLTTIEISQIIESVICDFPDLEGLYHVSSEPISKYNLLSLIKEEFCLSIDIIPDHEIKIDRTLNSSILKTATGYTAPSWQFMIEEMAKAN